MLAIVIGMLFVLGVACSVIFTVAWPNIRAGAWLLTPEGERLTRDARRRARKAAKKARSAASSVATSVRDRRPEPVPAPTVDPDVDVVIELPDADPVAGKIAAGIAARSRTVPPAQLGSPLATPATGVSETASR
ncbi:MAG: hypothetical protein IPJ14_22635 [Kineosporiaceae bacterium]|nr:hypothetical protein [Kineosporiaceae bacterium]MBK7625377.1 hypothetical protein [Kineosporiaceae bacterium]MBK8076260.1 hypothetical protein [Kineosporiaceae bacterium]